MAESKYSAISDPAKPPLPLLAEILIDRSLYEEMPVCEEDRDKLTQLREGNFQIDAHCIYCKNYSIFNTLRIAKPKLPASLAQTIVYAKEPSIFDAGHFSCRISCVRCSGIYQYYFVMSEVGLVKTGQFPSIEDIGSSDLKKYRRALDAADYSELKRATGLISHGIGIGSFVYLRRIFERLITKHHADQVEPKNKTTDFNGLRMDEKIKALSSALPPALVENRAIYNILSVGIHALDEETCKRYFPVVKAAILQILDQDIAVKKAKTDAKILQTEIERITGEVHRS